MQCPKCSNNYYRLIKTKYLPLIEVPSYADFQPMQKLSFCMKCGFYGVHKVEMFNNHLPLNINNFWSDEEIEEMKQR